MMTEATKRRFPHFTDDDVLNDMLAESDAFSREDESSDTAFYTRPRLVEHLDVAARERVSQLFDSLIVEDNPRVLDLMAAVSSHLPKHRKISELVGLGLNEEELQANQRLSKYVIQDLNETPALPFDDESFDVVLNTVSVQYITDPGRVFADVGRVLKPGGLFVVVFSDRSFPTKAIKVWELLTAEERIKFVTKFMEETGTFFAPRSYISQGHPRPKDDKYAHLGIPSDPIYAVFADKKGGDPNRPTRTIPHNTVAMPPDEVIERRKAEIQQTMQCPYCASILYRWRITENPWSTWDHDLHVCLNDSCPYLVRGWQEMYRQGNSGMSYRLVYDKQKNSYLTIPIPSLNVIKQSVDQ